MPRVKELRRPSQRIRVGSQVVLFPEPYAPTSGPHELDAEMPVPRGEVISVTHHPNNRSWITDAVVRDTETGEEICLSYFSSSGGGRVARADRPLGAIHKVTKF